MTSLTAEQQERVLGHMGLVRLYVSRQMRRLGRLTGQREREDMAQEGLIGLMAAASRHDPGKDGAFSSYAMSHIHGGVCRYLAGQMDGLAVPERAIKRIIRQRKRARQMGEPESLSLPRFQDMDSSLPAISRQTYREHQRRRMIDECRQMLADGVCRDVPGAVAGAGAPTIRSGPVMYEVVREQFEQAVRWAGGRLKAAKLCRPDRAALIEAVAEERLLVPDPRYRTSKRALARRFACSLSRVHQCERRYHTLIREYLVNRFGQRASCATVLGQDVGSPGSAFAGSPATGQRAGKVATTRDHFQPVEVLCSLGSGPHVPGVEDRKPARDGGGNRVLGLGRGRVWL